MKPRDLLIIIGIILFGCSSIADPYTWFAVAYAFFAISIALTSYGWQRSVAQAQAAKAKKGALKGAGYLINTRDTQQPIFVVYGKHKVGVNQLFIEVQDDHTLTFLAGLCEGPIQGVVRNTGNCLGLNVWFGERHLHLFHGFKDSGTGDPDEYHGYNLALGTADQMPLPVYSWAHLTEDRMRYTAYMAFRLHWDDQEDFAELGGFPLITAEIEGLLIHDPRTVIGHEGMQFGYREQLFAETGGGATFTKTSYGGVECLQGEVVGTKGAAHLFKTFPRTWLDGKTVQIKWRPTQAGGAPTTKETVYLKVRSGRIDRTCHGHFPIGEYFPSLAVFDDLGSLTTTGVADPWQTDSFVVECTDLKDEPLVTLCLTVKDDDAVRDFGWQVAFIKIKDSSGTVIAEETFAAADTLVAEETGTYRDYGTWLAADQAVDDPWFSDNPALVIYDIMTNERYGGGVPAALFDVDSVKDAATWCESKGYHFNGVLWEQDYLLDVVSLIASTFRMAVIFSGGYFKILCFDIEVPVLTFNESEIKEDSFRVILPTATDVPTQLRMKFPNQGNYYSLEDYILPGKQFIIDEGEVREKEIMTLGLTDYNLAKKLATYQLERSYYCNQYYFILGMKGMPLEAGDVIAVSHSVAGWPPESGRALRLTNVQYLPQGEVAVVGIPEYDSLYDDVLDVAVEEVYTTVLPRHDVDEIPEVIPPVTAVVLTKEDIWQGQTVVPRVKCTFTLPEYGRSVEAWYSPDGVVWGIIGAGFTTCFYHTAFYYATHHYKLLTVMADNKKMALADAADNTITITGSTGTTNLVASEALAAGDHINIFNDGGVTKARKALAAVYTDRKEAHAFVSSAYGLGDTLEAHLLGSNINVAGLTRGLSYYLSPTVAGNVDATAPSAGGQMIQKVGVAKSATELIFQPGTPKLVGETVEGLASSYTCADDVTQGDAVGLYVDGIRKGWALVVEGEQDRTGTIDGQILVIRMTNSRILLIRSNSATSEAVVGDFDASYTVTWRDAGAAILDGHPPEFGIAAARLDNTHFVVCYRGTGDSNHMKSVVGEIAEAPAAGTITFGAVEEVEGDNCGACSVVRITNAKFFIAFKSAALIKGAVGNVAGTAITLGALKSFDADSDDCPCAVFLGDDYSVDGETRYLVKVYYTFSGAVYSEMASIQNLTIDTPAGMVQESNMYATNTPWIQAHQGACALADESKMDLLVWAETAASKRLFVALSRNRDNFRMDMEIPDGVIEEIPTADEYTNGMPLSLGDKDFLVAFSHFTGDHGYLRRGRISEDCPPFEGTSLVEWKASAVPYLSMCKLLNGVAVIAYCIGGSPYDTAIKVVKYGQYLGIAAQTKTTGDSCLVVEEGISGNHSGLTTGQVYYGEEDGDVVDAATPWRLGRALNSSTILLAP